MITIRQILHGNTAIPEQAQVVRSRVASGTVNKAALARELKLSREYPVPVPAGRFTGRVDRKARQPHPSLVHR